jgi:SMC interacting uncharacterized protein involved in chromosome segregation
MEALIKITYDKQKVTIDEIDYWVENPVYFTVSELKKLDPDDGLNDGKITDELQKAIDERIDRDVKQPFIDSIMNRAEYIEPPREDYVNIINSRQAEIDDQEEKMRLYGGFDYTEDEFRSQVEKLQPKIDYAEQNISWTDEELRQKADSLQSKLDSTMSSIDYTADELQAIADKKQEEVNTLTSVIANKRIIGGKLGGISG